MVYVKLRYLVQWTDDVAVPIVNFILQYYWTHVLYIERVPKHWIEVFTAQDEKVFSRKKESDIYSSTRALLTFNKMEPP